MAKKIAFGRPLGRHYIREWREYRGLTLERLAERLDGSSASISRIETRDQPYSQEVLEALADALDCTLRDLLEVNPQVPAEADVLSLYRKASPEKRTIVKTILETPTE